MRKEKHIITVYFAIGRVEKCGRNISSNQARLPDVLRLWLLLVAAVLGPRRPAEKIAAQVGAIYDAAVPSMKRNVSRREHPWRHHLEEV